MDNKKFEKLIKELDKLESKINKMNNKEDVTTEQSNILYDIAESISKSLKSFNQYDEY